MAITTTPGATAPALAVIDGIPTTTSVEVAQHFGKDHAEVLKRIRSLLPELSSHAGFFTAMVNEVQIGSGAIRKDPAFRLTRDGFTLLAMGFTGKKALSFKLAYIDAFNRMERELRAAAPKANPAIDYERISPAQAQELKELVHQVVDAKVQGFGETWRRLHNKFRVNSYLELPAARFNDARQYLLNKMPQEQTGTLQTTIARLTEQVAQGNSYPAELLRPLHTALSQRLGQQAIDPTHMLVKRQHIEDLWTDLGRLRSRIDGLGMLESDLPPSWWQSKRISTTEA